MSSDTKSSEVNTIDSFFVDDEKSTTSRRAKKSKKSPKYTLRPDCEPFIPSGNISSEIHVTRVLDYSENDFPILGCGSKQPKNRIQVNDPVTTLSTAEPIERKLRKLLKSNEHKEAFKVNLDEIFPNVSDKPKHKIRPVKHFKERVSLSGNPLDSDNPIRKKGIISSKPKIKRISRTKAMVYAAREEMQKLKAISERISIEDGLIRTDGDASLDEIWKPVCFFKAKDIKQCIQKVEPQDPNEKKHEAGTELEPFNERDTESVHSSDSESTPNCTVSLQNVLENSQIPPYKLLIHNNNFKRYCDNCVTSELNKIAEKLITQLVRYQYKKYQTDPVKAAAKKRYVLGLRQVKKYTKMNKIKLIVFVPNMEESLYELVEELKSLANAYCIPYMFAFSRKKLGKIAYKKIGVSCFGILDYSGADEHFKSCIEVLNKAKKLYNEKCSLAKIHFEEYFNNRTTSGDEPLIIEDISEEIVKDFMLKLSICENDKQDDSDSDDNS